MMLARIFWQTGRFPKEVLELPFLEREFVYGAAEWMLEMEHEANKPKG